MKGHPPLLPPSSVRHPPAGKALCGWTERGRPFGLLALPLAILALLLISGAGPAAVTPHASAPLPAVSTASTSSSYLYFNGTVAGNGGTQTVNVPVPPNGTVWDLVSAKITIVANSPVSSFQNSYLYDSTCTELNVAPAPSVCKGVYGPNVDGIANDVMDSGKYGTVVGEGGYAPTAPAGVAIYTHYEQTIHLTHDMFISFGADLSGGVSSSYYLVFNPEVGNYSSFAFYRWATPVGPLSSTPTTVDIPGPPTGYYYRAEVAVATIDLGSSSLQPYRSAEILEEPSGTVLTSINSWSVAGPGVTEDSCGGYSAAQTCVSDPTGTATIWANPVLVSSSEYLAASFVGVSGDLGVFAVVVTEYPANTTSVPPAAPTGLSVVAASASQLNLSWTNPSGALTDSYVNQYSGSSCAGTPTAVNVGSVVSSYAINDLSAGTTYSYRVAAANSVGEGTFSACASGTTDEGPPSAPTNLSATPASSSSIDLRWTNPSGVVSDDHVITYSGPGCTGSSVISDLGSVEDSYTSTGLSSSTTYSYEVEASNSAGTGPASDCASATTGAPGASIPLTAVQFIEQGLDPGVLWWVSVTGPESERLTSTDTTISFNLTNGSYSYTLGSFSTLNASNPEGLFTVPFSASTITVNFTNASRSTTGGSPPSSSGGSPPASFPTGEVVGLTAAAIALGGCVGIGTSRAVWGRTLGRAAKSHRMKVRRL